MNNLLISSLSLSLSLSLSASGEVEFGYGKLVDDANSHIEFNRSYQCNDSRNFTGHDAHTNFSFILNMRNFSVQAFSFRNSSSGEFDDRKSLSFLSLCSFDTIGLKLVSHESESCAHHQNQSQFLYLLFSSCSSHL